ncbi:TIGR03086 family metal-binding protein [Actinophytocola gossypii]|uniref:TIGR03086 family protein n=1 Tax=Actinophytocola gossypii TaxID=2812003 RepID=A0ABT2JK47_9PSEU|nr:TIGR03086 family metal-binding protein [Actinophytocola gossypii]MCT2587899.1 TIGR03086 family protein [Actinophytocola gossypii]
MSADLLERAVGYALGALRSVPPAALGLPTPCRGWPLRVLVAHVDDALLALHEAADLGRVRLEPPEDPADPVSAARERARLVLGAWSRPSRASVSVAGTDLAADLLTTAGAVEVAVHGWDVARALGRDHPLPAALAAELLELSPALVTDVDRPSRFAPPIPLPRGAPPGDRLLAFLGREP